MAQVEPFVSLSESLLSLGVLNAVGSIDGTISSAADPGHLFVKNNWCGDAWVWDSLATRFFKIPMLVQDANGSSNCL